MYPQPASSSGVSRDERQARATGDEREALGTTGRKNVANACQKTCRYLGKFVAFLSMAFLTHLFALKVVELSGNVFYTI